MKKSRFSEEQIVSFLKQAEQGLAVKELCRSGGFSEATSYNWRARYGGLATGEACPKTGRWCCVEDGGTLSLKEGQLMPAAVIGLPADDHEAKIIDAILAGGAAYNQGLGRTLLTRLD
jgi:putative transposase